MELRLTDSKIHALKLREGEKPAPLQLLPLSSKDGEVPFKVCELGVPTFALGLGALPAADGLQQLQAASPTAPTGTSVVEGSFLVANSPCEKSTNPQDRRNEKHKKREGGWGCGGEESTPPSPPSPASNEKHSEEGCEEPRWGRTPRGHPALHTVQSVHWLAGRSLWFHGDG